MTDLSELGLLKMGVGEVFKKVGGGERHIGYVLATPDEEGEAVPGAGAQYQRWMLYEPTENSFEVRPSEKLAGLSLDEWPAFVKRTWQERKPLTLIWGRARIYVYGGTYGGVTWTSLPTELPAGLDPGKKDIVFQIDVTGGKPSLVDVRQEGASGFVLAIQGMRPTTTHEYWCLGPGASPGAPATMAPSGRSAASTAEISRLAAPFWGPGATLTIVGCVSTTCTDSLYWDP